MSAQETHHPPDTRTPLWHFALALWQQESARNLCLQLQEHGWSVTRLLCAGWLATRGLAYPGNEPDSLQQWRANVTEPVRSLKKTLSKSDSLLVPLREALAKAELEAERIELYRAWLVIRNTDVAGPDLDTAQVAEYNLRRAAPDTTGSINEKTEPMIRHLAQLINVTPAEAGTGGPGDHPA